MRIVLPVLWLAAIGWVALCFYLSWQSGEDTAAFSGGLSDFLLRIFHAVKIEADAVLFHRLLRRYSHVLVFFVAAVLFECAFFASFYPRVHWTRRATLGAFAVSSAAAWIAEGAKVWIPGRHFDLGETLLNEAGVLCGILLVWAVCRFFMRRRYRKRPAAAAQNDAV